MDASKGLTELVDLDPSRVDLVKNPANGFPILMMKALSAPETEPDTSGTEIAKDAEVPEPTAVAPVETPAAVEPPAEQAPVEKSVAELVTEEVAKAMAPLTERNKALEDEMAALKSLPIPGGPVVTVPAAHRSSSEQAHQAAEASRFRRLAKDVTDRDLVQFYEAKAAEAEKASRA